MPSKVTIRSSRMSILLWKKSRGFVTSSLSKIFGGKTTKSSGLLTARVRSSNSVLPEPRGATTRQLLSFLVSGSFRFMDMELTIGIIAGRNQPFNRDSTLDANCRVRAQSSRNCLWADREIVARGGNLPCLKVYDN